MVMAGLFTVVGTEAFVSVVSHMRDFAERRSPRRLFRKFCKQHKNQRIQARLRRLKVHRQAELFSCCGSCHADTVRERAIGTI